VIRIDRLWLCTAPVDMRAGAERLLAAVVATVGAAHAHHGNLFANARATRVKLLVHDGFGVWCAARRLNAGRFEWPLGETASGPLSLTQAQFDALVVGLPWRRLPEMGADPTPASASTDSLRNAAQEPWPNAAASSSCTWLRLTGQPARVWRVCHVANCGIGTMKLRRA